MSDLRKRWRRPRLSTQILLLQLAIIVLTVGVGVVVSIVEARKQLDEAAGRRSLVIARTVAAIPEIARAFSLQHPERRIDPIAERIRKTTDASFVVVADRRGIRYSHPVKSKIGKSLRDDPGEPVDAILAGHEFVGVQSGSIGRSVRAKVPLRDARGHIMGLVSVGVLERNISVALRSNLPVILIPPALGLALGLVGSVLLARRIKRQTFGLEPNEIAGLLEQREAMLHGIREGTVATDTAGRVTLVNDEAKRLLDLDDSALGRRVDELVPAGHVREVLAGNVDLPDQVVLVNDRVLVVNRMPVSIRGQEVGAVITIRNRTELEGLVRERDEAVGLARALRAQEHDFSHKLHVIAGLIELERYDDAIRFINQSSLVHQALVGSIVDHIGDPALVALLLGKAAVASERGIELRVADDTRLPEEVDDAPVLISVVGNLVDNAIESVGETATTTGWIEVTIREESDGIAIRVHDSGPGIDPALAEEIFEDGFTTKAAGGASRRGLGLALVLQAVRRRGGSVEVENVEGALFRVFLPHRTPVASR